MLALTTRHGKTSMAFPGRFVVSKKMDTKKEERFSDLRVDQAIEVGAQVLAASCPYCILNFEDSVLTMDKADVLEVKDISELVQEAI
jgi:Fe-S oxidoreductase